MTAYAVFRRVHTRDELPPSAHQLFPVGVTVCATNACLEHDVGRAGKVGQGFTQEHFGLQRMLPVDMTVAACLRILIGCPGEDAVPQDAVTFEASHLVIMHMLLVQRVNIVDTGHALPIVTTATANGRSMSIPLVDGPMAVMTVDILTAVEELRMIEAEILDGDRLVGRAMAGLAVAGFMRSNAVSMKMTQEAGAGGDSDVLTPHFLGVTGGAGQITSRNHGIMMQTVVEMNP